MTAFPRSVWQQKKWLQTTHGVFVSAFNPGNNGEEVLVITPEDTILQFHCPSLTDWCLMAENGKLTIYWTENPGDRHEPRRTPTPVPCGDPVGIGGVLVPPPPTGGNDVTDLTPVTSAVAKLAEAQDRMWTDLVGRIKAHEEADSARVNAVQRGVSDLPDAIIGEVPAGDHFGLDPRARFNNKWQELFAYMWTQRQDFLQVVFERGVEAGLNLRKEGFNPETGKYDLPKQ